METKKDNLKKVKDNQADEPPLSETECKNASDDALPSETAEKSKEKAKSEKPKKKKRKHLESHKVYFSSLRQKLEGGQTVFDYEVRQALQAAQQNEEA